jgi:hypothetical protein
MWKKKAGKGPLFIVKEALKNLPKLGVAHLSVKHPLVTVARPEPHSGAKAKRGIFTTLAIHAIPARRYLLSGIQQPLKPVLQVAVA